MVNEHGLIVKTFFNNTASATLWEIDAVLLLSRSKGKCASLFTINQNDVGVRFDGDRKYIIKEDGYTVSIWKDAGIVYAMVI